jgi:hypothetical protein
MSLRANTIVVEDMFPMNTPNVLLSPPLQISLEIVTNPYKTHMLH